MLRPFRPQRKRRYGNGRAPRLPGVPAMVARTTYTYIRAWIKIAVPRQRLRMTLHTCLSLYDVLVSNLDESGSSAALRGTTASKRRKDWDAAGKILHE